MMWIPRPRGLEITMMGVFLALGALRIEALYQINATLPVLSPAFVTNKLKGNTYDDNRNGNWQSNYRKSCRNLSFCGRELHNNSNGKANCCHQQLHLFCRCCHNHKPESPDGGHLELPLRNNTSFVRGIDNTNCAFYLAGLLKIGGSIRRRILDQSCPDFVSPHIKRMN
jgi:hypothetical protein